MIPRYHAPYLNALEMSHDKELYKSTDSLLCGVFPATESVGHVKFCDVLQKQVCVSDGGSQAYH